MSTWLVYAVTAAYASVAVDQFIKDNMPGAIMYAGYAIANIGVIGMLK